jgi:hypothetical protein
LVKKLRQEKEALVAKKTAAEELYRAMKSASSGKSTPEKEEKVQKAT